MNRRNKRQPSNGSGAPIDQSLARKAVSWVAVAALTAVACLICWRLSLTLGTTQVLAAAYAIPAAVAMRSMTQAFSSFCAVSFVGVALLSEDGTGARLGFVLTGLSIAAGTLYLTVGAGEKLAEARRALGLIRLKALSTQDAVQQAGVCVVAVSTNLTWLFVNEAAWSAFGADSGLRRGMDARVEMDDEAATALMHSGSRESWRRFFESAIADVAASSLQPGNSLPPYRVTLFDREGRRNSFLFTVTMGQQDELQFVGIPRLSQVASSKDTQSAAEWFGEVVDSFAEPSVIIQSNGAILASNGSFRKLCGAGECTAFIFDCAHVHGVSEERFSAAVWLPTREGPKELPDVFLEEAGPCVAARIASPKDAHIEAAVLVFKDTRRPLPDGFEEATQPMGL